NRFKYVKGNEPDSEIEKSRLDILDAPEGIHYKTYRNEEKNYESMKVLKEGAYSKEEVENLGNFLIEDYLSNTSVVDTKYEILRDFPNFNPDRYINLSLSHSDISYKKDSLYIDSYINGLKVFKKDSLQRDIFTGSVKNYIEVNSLEKYMGSSSFSRLENNGFIDSNTNIINVLKARSLAESERFIHSFKISNFLENQTDIISTSGVYIHSKDIRNVDIRSIRVFINVPEDSYYRRINPTIYNIFYDDTYGHYRIRINGINIPEGTEIVLANNGLTNNKILYDKLFFSDGIVDSLPIVDSDDEGHIITETYKCPEDVEVVVEGLTLIPNRDYTVVNSRSLDTPSMIAFRNVIPNDKEIEVSLFEDNSTFTHYIPYPNERTYNRFSMENDLNPFIKGHFEVFVNNKRIPMHHVRIVNHRTIEINNYNDDLVNIMVRFNTRSHYHVDEIITNYKYNIMDMNDESWIDYYRV